MRLATIVEDGRPSVAVVRDGRVLALDLADEALRSVRGIAAGGAPALDRIRAWVARQPGASGRPVEEVELGPAVPDPGAIYTIGLNYATPGRPEDVAPERPLVYAKLPTSVAGHRATLAWDRSLTPNVDPEVELGVVIGAEARSVAPEEAMEHVFGYTCVDDVSSRDPWLDGDQWLLGKSMAGFCPVGPWVVTSDELDPADLRLGCTIGGIPIQAGSTAQMRFAIAEVISYVSRHVALLPGDLIATGTPARLPGPPGPERHLETGDEVTVWIDGIGELTTRIG